ncbi:MAG: hypothetical protein Q8920_14775 [Bacillota bacterium]|nr:hypothetical protein [Bacillota bacterium]
MASPKENRRKTKPHVDIKQNMLSTRFRLVEQTEKILSGIRVYLSGPMDFVASKEIEKRTGWRSRLSQFLQEFQVTVYDPWNKPEVVGMPHYGKEDEFSANERYNWTFEDSPSGDRVRAELCDEFWATMHIDLRMVNSSDFLISYCPSNIYSVGTVHEIVMARQECKPVLFVSPPVSFPAMEELKEYMEDKGDEKGVNMLEKLVNEAPLLPNPKGIPSMWYMALIDGHYFFDGFGFKPYIEKFNWEYGPLDEREERFPPRRPLLPYLEELNNKIPKRFDLELNKYVENPEWLIFNLPGQENTE